MTMQRALKGFLRFWYDFVIGDDWKIAVAVAGPLAVGALAVLLGAGSSPGFAPVVAASIAVTFTAAIWVDTRSARGR